MARNFLLAVRFLLLPSTEGALSTPVQLLARVSIKTASGISRNAKETWCLSTTSLPVAVVYMWFVQPTKMPNFITYRQGLNQPSLWPNGGRRRAHKTCSARSTHFRRALLLNRNGVDSHIDKQAGSNSLKNAVALPRRRPTKNQPATSALYRHRCCRRGRGGHVVVVVMM